MTGPTTITIDDVKYVRADSVTEKAEKDGKPYVIVRSRDQGVMCGYLDGYNGRAVHLINARQIWRYDSDFVLSDMAEKGARNPDKCQFSVEMSQPMIMLEACGILYCTKIAAESLQSVKATVKK